jgi:hypothetical protein
MRRAFILFILMICLFLPLVTHATSPSDRFWDPFRAVPGNLSDQFSDALDALLRDTEKIAGRSVSLFRIPDPLRVGFRALSAYRPGFLGLKFSQETGIPAPPSPVAGDRTFPHTRCGDKDGDPFWAEDCSCRCKDPCPENDNRSCEDCRNITRPDRFVATVEACRRVGEDDIEFDHQ